MTRATDPINSHLLTGGLFTAGPSALVNRTRASVPAKCPNSRARGPRREWLRRGSCHPYRLTGREYRNRRSGSGHRRIHLRDRRHDVIGIAARELRIERHAGEAVEDLARARAAIGAVTD